MASLEKTAGWVSSQLQNREGSATRKFKAWPTRQGPATRPRVRQRLGFGEANGKFSTLGRAASGSYLLFGFASSELLDPFNVLEPRALLAIFAADGISK